LYNEKKYKINDSELEGIVNNAKQGDEKSLAMLCEYLYPKIFTYCFYRVNHKEDAEDLTGEVFLRMARSISTQHGRFSAWIYKIAFNIVTDFYRHRASEKNAFSESGADYINKVSAGDETDKILNQEQLKKALGMLTEEQRNVLILKFVQGYSNDEAAEILGKSTGAVKVLQFRAVKTLKELFARDVWQ